MSLGLTIGQVAKQVGVNVQAVRYYERLKLLVPIARKSSGYRLYGPIEMRRLRFIKNAQALGFTLHEIFELLALRISSRAQCGDVLGKAQVKLTQVETKIQALQAMAQTLRRLMRACREGMPTDRCPILQCLEQNYKGNALGTQATALASRSGSAGTRKGGR